MTQLLEIARTFKVSQPVFWLTFNEDFSRITASEPIYKFEPQVKEGDLLSELVCSHYTERFSMDLERFTIDHEEIADRAMQEVRRKIVDFLEENLEMRSPTQSKVYRWFSSNLPTNSPYFDDMMVHLYKYMRQFTDNKMREMDASSGENHPQILNILALMTAIMEKYE